MAACENGNVLLVEMSHHVSWWCMLSGVDVPEEKKKKCTVIHDVCYKAMRSLFSIDLV